jgi:hypothetical protein
MHLASVKREKSPDTADCLRLTGVLKFASGEELSIWVDVPMALADEVSISGNPWLVAMLPMAASRGENISLSIPVDALLLENLRGVLAIWRDWYPELHDVAIECPVADRQEPTATKTAAFFSGGIDSYFTIARRMPANPYGLPVVGRLDDLITVWGFDVRVDDTEQFRPLAEMLAASANALGFRNIIVRTNLRAAERYMPFKDAWRRLTHGAGLAFVGLIVEPGHKEVLIGSSYVFGELFPWGSHPMLDPLFSTSGMQFVHDGASFTRVQKTEVVAKFPPAHSALHVCFAQGAMNCSKCDKCYRTMITLDVLGCRDQTSLAFNWPSYSVQAVRKLFIRSTGDRAFAAQIRALANARGRHDVVEVLDFAAVRSRLLLPLVRASEWLAQFPGIWRVAVPLKGFLMRGPIRKI